MKRLLILVLLSSLPLHAVTWYVNASGGSRFSTNMTFGMCDGQSSAAYPGTTNLIWLASTSYALNTVIVDTNGNYEKATTAGTSNSSSVGPPAWPAHGSSGATTNDNSPLVWTSQGAAPFDQHCSFNDIRYLWADGSFADGLHFPAWGWVVAGGDTALIDCSAMPGGTCRIGYSGPNSTDHFLAIAGDPGSSGMPTPPAGTSGAHTQIFGINHAACTAAASKTKLHGGYGTGGVIGLKGANYVDIACFDVTDDSTCGRSGSAALCQTGFPLDDYANDGIDFSNATTNTTVTDVYLHGLANVGLGGPTGNNVSITRVVASGNSSSGWNMDNGTTGTGTLNMEQFATIFSGCNEIYPIVSMVTVPNDTINGGQVGQVTDCSDDNIGGYGDGIGTATLTSSPAWTMTLDHSLAIWNTQDGFDLLHLRGNGSTLTATNNISYGNMGQQLKVGAAGVSYNNYLVGNCNADRQAIPGQPAVTTYTVTAYSVASGSITFTYSGTPAITSGVYVQTYGTVIPGDLNYHAWVTTAATSTTFTATYSGSDTSGSITGNAFTGWDAGLSDYCRAADVAVVVSVNDGVTTKFDFNTILSANATMVEIPVDNTCATGAGSTCLLDIRNNVFLGFTSNTANGYPLGGSGSNPGVLFFDTVNPLPNTGSLWTNNSTHGQKVSWVCPQSGESNAQCGDPGLTDETWHLYSTGNAVPAATNTVVGNGVTISGITLDITGALRPSPPAIGAYELSGAISAPINFTGTLKFSGNLVVK